MIVHGAASVSFDQSLEEARAINVEGTRRMLELAGRARELRRARPLCPDFDRVRRRHPRRPVLRVRPRRRPELPQLLRAVEVRGRAARALAARACRSRSCARASSSATATAAGPPPSTSSTGRCARSLADCSRRCRRSRRHRSTSSRSTTSPTAIHELCESDGGIGQTYHLTAGAEASTIGEIAELASGYFQQPLPRLLPPAEFMSADHGVARSMLEEGAMYFPYFSVATTFDDAFTRAQLQPAGISVSPLRDYMSRLLDYATRAHWGKSPIARVDAAAVFAGV